MDNIMDELDFGSFEDEFRLPNRDMNAHIHITRNPKTKQKVEKVLFVPNDRARNMSEYAVIISLNFNALIIGY